MDINNKIGLYDIKNKTNINNKIGIFHVKIGNINNKIYL